jgi:hypothetical protein
MFGATDRTIGVQFMQAWQEPRDIRSCGNSGCAVSFYLTTVRQLLPYIVIPTQYQTRDG